MPPLSSSDQSPLFRKPKRKWRVFISILCLLFLLAGVMGAAAVFAYKNVPSIANINGCFTTSMFHVSLCPQNANYVRYQNLPKHLIASLIASEDATFFFHKGFDWDEMKDSLEKSMDAGRWVRGGSTITQQLAKNLYLSKDKTLMRKLKEFFIAKQIEEKLTKPQIIEKYLNVVEFAKGVYGIQNGAQHYFQKPPSALSPAESAYLVSLLPNPVKYSTAFHAHKELSRFNKRRVASILYILKVQGKISEEDYNYEVARAEIGLWTPYAPEVMFSPDGGDEQALPQDEEHTDEQMDSDEAPDLNEDAE
jgi:monofunctional glycosyltransferase